MDEILNIVSIGYVVKDKEIDSYIIEAYPVSLIPTAVGDLSKTNEEIINTTDMLGNNISVVVNTSNTIECYWLNNGNSNRLTAPDVCKGEMVFIYNIFGQDRYYWDTVSLKTTYRKREKDLYFWSNKGAIDTTKEYLKKGYFLLMDTYKKLVHFHTANNDGEYCMYDISIDTKKGSILIKDSVDNFIELASHQGHLTVTTTKNVTVNTKVVTVNAEESSTVNTKVAEVNAEVSSTVNTKTANINGSSSVNIKGGVVNIN